MTEPRGIRNNNPGNIRKSKNMWQGLAKDQPDSDFVTFDTMAYGVRAAAKIFLSYLHTYGLKSVQALISRWAPSNENDTKAYVAYVSKTVGVQPTDAIDISDPKVLESLCHAVFHVENGGDYVSAADLQEGVKLAL